MEIYILTADAVCVLEKLGSLWFHCVITSHTGREKRTKSKRQRERKRHRKETEIKRGSVNTHTFSHLFFASRSRGDTSKISHSLKGLRRTDSSSFAEARGAGKGLQSTGNLISKMCVRGTNANVGRRE